MDQSGKSLYTSLLFLVKHVGQNSLLAKITSVSVKQKVTSQGQTCTDQSKITKIEVGMARKRSSSEKLL